MSKYLITMHESDNQMLMGQQMFDEKKKIISHISNESSYLRSAKMLQLDYLVLKAQSGWGWSDLLKGYENEKKDCKNYSISSYTTNISDKYEDKKSNLLKVDINDQKIEETQNLLRKRKGNHEESNL